jgi:site-specific DNA recombinase
MSAGEYVRISQDREGQALGVGRQEQDCRQLAGRRGWEIARVYSDNDRSATSGTRPAWKRLLADLEAGSIDRVVAYSSSRMYRRLKDLLPLLELVKARPIEIATVASGNINLDTADGRMIANILASVDQAEAERTGERVKRQQRTRREAGLPHSGGKPLYPNLRTAADMILAGHSPAAASRAISNGHGRILTTHLRRSLLSRRALFEGVVTADEQATLGALLAQKSTRRPGALKFVLSGLATCGRCGGLMVGNRISYVCTPGTGCGNTSIRAARLEELVIDALPARMTVKPAQTAETRDHVAKLRVLEARRDALGEAFASGDLTSGQVRAATETLDPQIDDLRDRVAAAMGDDFKVLASVSPKILLADAGYRERWESRTLTPAEIEEARSYVRRAFASITVNPATGKRWDPSRVEIQGRPGPTLPGRGRRKPQERRSSAARGVATRRDGTR